MSTVNDAYPIEPTLPDSELLANLLGLDPAYIHSTYVDQNHDGIYDHVRWQIPIGLFPPHLLADPNRNGIPNSNTILVDLDRDGFYETHLNPMDLDHDGQVDHWVGYTGAPHGELVAESVLPPTPVDDVPYPEIPPIFGHEMPVGVDGVDILPNVPVSDDLTTHPQSTDLAPEHVGGEALPGDSVDTDIPDVL